MRRVLEGEIAGALYRRRQVMIEPVFADTKFNRRIDRFLRRGHSAARSEWRLITASGNLLKLHRHQLRLASPDPGERAQPREREHWVSDVSGADRAFSDRRGRSTATPPTTAAFTPRPHSTSGSFSQQPPCEASADAERCFPEGGAIARGIDPHATPGVRPQRALVTRDLCFSRQPSLPLARRPQR
jgi:hypothetical protein